MSEHSDISREHEAKRKPQPHEWHTRRLSDLINSLCAEIFDTAVDSGVRSGETSEEVLGCLIEVNVLSLTTQASMKMQMSILDKLQEVHTPCDTQRPSQVSPREENSGGNRKQSPPASASNPPAVSSNRKARTLWT